MIQTFTELYHKYLPNIGDEEFKFMLKDEEYLINDEIQKCYICNGDIFLIKGTTNIVNYINKQQQMAHIIRDFEDFEKIKKIMFFYGMDFNDNQNIEAIVCNCCKMILGFKIHDIWIYPNLYYNHSLDKIKEISSNSSYLRKIHEKKFKLHPSISELRILCVMKKNGELENMADNFIFLLDENMKYHNLKNCIYFNNTYQKGVELVYNSEKEEAILNLSKIPNNIKNIMFTEVILNLDKNFNFDLLDSFQLFLMDEETNTQILCYDIFNFAKNSSAIELLCFNRMNNNTWEIEILNKKFNSNNIQNIYYEK